MKNINFKLKFGGGGRFCLLKNKNAFTLVEIIVAVTILIILTSIWFLYYSTYAPKARDVVRNQDLVNISDVMDNALSAWKDLFIPDWAEENSVKFLETWEIKWIKWTFWEKNSSKYKELLWKVTDPKWQNYDYYLSEDWKFYRLEWISESTWEKIVKTNYEVDKVTRNVLSLKNKMKIKIADLLLIDEEEKNDYIDKIGKAENLEKANAKFLEIMWKNDEIIKRRLPTNNLPTFAWCTGCDIFFEGLQIDMTVKINDLDGDRTRMSAINLPKWLRLEGNKILWSVEKAWIYNFTLVFTDWIQKNSINVNPFTVNSLPIAYGCSNNMAFWSPYYDGRGWFLINSNPLSMNWGWDIWVYVKNYKNYTKDQILQLILDKYNSWSYVPMNFWWSWLNSCFIDNNDIWNP